MGVQTLKKSKFKISVFAIFLNSPMHLVIIVRICNIGMYYTLFPFQDNGTKKGMISVTKN